MYLHHSVIHFTRRVLRPNIFAARSINSTNRMTVLTPTNFYRMETKFLLFTTVLHVELLII